MDLVRLDRLVHRERIRHLRCRIVDVVVVVIVYLNFILYSHVHVTSCILTIPLKDTNNIKIK